MHRHRWRPLGARDLRRRGLNLILDGQVARGCQCGRVTITPTARRQREPVTDERRAEVAEQHHQAGHDLEDQAVAELVDRGLPPIGGAAGVTWIAAVAGNWSSAANWSTVAVPAAGDDVQIGSGAGATQSNCTIDVNTNVIRSINCTSYTGVLTISAAIALNIGGASAGNVTLNATMTFTAATTSTINLTHTVGGNSIQLSGHTTGNMTFNGVGGVWTLAAAMFTAAASTVTLTNGTLNTNGWACTWGMFGLGVGTKTLTLGASAITITGNTGTGNTGWNSNFNSTNTTLNAASSTLTFAASSAGMAAAAGHVYGTINMNAAGTPFIGGSQVTCATFNRTGTAVKTDSLQLSSGLTVTGTCMLASNSTTNRLLVSSGVLGTQRTLTAATLVCSGVIDFQDINAAGAAIWTTAASGATYFGDCQGNSGITFTPAAAQTWSGNTTGNSSTAANWTSRVPLPQDDILVPALTSGALTFDMPRLGKNLDFTGSTGGKYILSSSAQVVYGNLTLVAALNLTSSAFSFQFAGRGSQTINAAGLTIQGVFIFSAGGTYTLLGDMVISTGNLIGLTQGTLDLNGHNLSTPSLSVVSAIACALKLGSGTFTVSGTGTVWNVTNASLVVTAGTGTIVISDVSAAAKTFIGGGYTYNVLQITAGGAGAVTIANSNTFAGWTVTGPKTITLTAGTTQTIQTAAGWNVNGSAGNLVTINSTSAGTAATISIASGNIVSDYLSLQDNTATGGATFWAGDHSTNVSGNTGWTFASLFTLTCSSSTTVSSAATIASAHPRAAASSTTTSSSAAKAAATARTAASSTTMTSAAARANTAAARTATSTTTTTSVATRTTAAARTAASAATTSSTAARSTITQARTASSSTTTGSSTAARALAVARTATSSTTATSAAARTSSASRTSTSATSTASTAARTLAPQRTASSTTTGNSTVTAALDQARTVTAQAIITTSNTVATTTTAGRRWPYHTNPRWNPNPNPNPRWAYTPN